jgi:hypothetical protein
LRAWVAIRRPAKPRSPAIAAFTILVGIEAALGAVCYVVSGRRWERTALYLLAVSAPLEVYRTAVGKIDISLFRLSLLVAFAVLVLGSPGRRWALARWARLPLVLTYSALGVVVVVALVVHPINQFLGVREAAQIAIGIVALAITAELVCRESPERAASAIVLGSALPVLAAAWQAIGPRIGASGALPLLDKLPAARGLEITRQALSSFGSVGGRAKGTFGDPDHFGVYLIFAMCIALALTLHSLQRDDRRSQISFAAMSTAGAVTLAATYSRSAWIGGALGALIITGWSLAAWGMGRLRLPGRRVLVPIIVGVVAVAAVEAPSVIERATPGSKINVVSDREHASTVRFAFNRFTAHPLLGIGPGGLGVELKLPPRTSGASSTYLSVAAQVGAFGLLALLAGAAIAMWMLTRAYRSLEGRALRVLPLGLGAAYLGFMAANVTYDVWFDDFHWVVLGVVAGLYGTLLPATEGAGLGGRLRVLGRREAHA